jgi:exopolysaccharide biosynthesis polyprenyl glycosylphosphotransferase
MFSQRARFITFRCLLNDAIVTAIAFIAAYAVRSWAGKLIGQSLGPLYPLGTYVPFLLASVATFPLVGYVLGAYRRIEFRKPRDIANDVAKVVALGFLALLALLFVYRGGYVSRTLLLAFLLLQAVFLGGSRWLLLAGSTWIRTRPQHKRNFVIVGTPASAAQLACLLEEGEKFGFRLLAFVYTGSTAPRQPPGLNNNYPILSKDRLPELLHTNVVDEVVFALDKEDLVQFEPLMQQCEEEGVHMRVQLDFLPKNFSRVFVEHLENIPLLSFASPQQNEFARFFKRTVDTVVASAALALLSPLFLLLALLIKITSPGPVFYRQVRCGLGGRRFTLLKFRSMVANAEELQPHLEAMNELDGPAFKIRNDPRRTTIGRWMRVLSLDELPQFWNVLRGDMSLVGPRPPLPREVEQYEPWQRRRLRIRPGLTCLWALEGRNQLQFDRWIRLDLLYMDNWSMWLDFKILIRTIPAVLFGKGAH